MEFCERWKIKRLFSTPYHPQTSSQVEALNKILKHTLKAKLEDRKGKQASTLPDVLWAYMTTTRNSTGEIPFALTFSTKAIIPSEVEILNYRTSQALTRDNDVARRLDLNVLEECRLASVHRNAAYKQRSERYYNSMVKIRQFLVCDLVIKKVHGPSQGFLGCRNGYTAEPTSSSTQTTLWTNTHGTLVNSRSTSSERPN